MTQDEAFLATILAAPDDDVPRLVYADWLDDQGQSDRAEMIREQIELANLPRAHPRRRVLEAKVWDWNWGPHNWDVEVKELVKDRYYVRGFVEKVEFRTYRDFLRAAARLFALAPVQHVTIEQPWIRFLQSAG
jgi:uncharacterized protein (TIGR02996 family)